MKFSKYISQQTLFSSADNGDGEIRTLDPLLARQVLSQLSYAPILMGLSGLEPPTSRLSGVRSNQLSYRPIFESYGSLKTEQYFEISDVRPTRS